MDELRRHQYNVAKLCKSIGTYMGLTLNEIKHLEIAAAFHDVGKKLIPRSILNKKGTLSAAEFEIIKMHSEYGADLLKKDGFDDVIVSAVRYHHERYDGKGYPDGLNFYEIPLFSKIIAVADAYDVMINGRVYKRAMTYEKVLDEIVNNSGKQFDPEIVNTFIRIFGKEKIYV